MEYRLCDLTVGQEGILQEPRVEGLLACRLKQFGMVEGTVISCLRIALLGSPIVFRVRGTVITLRREDCRKLSVVVL